MKLGAQFYTLRERAKTPEGVETCFRAMKEIGYDNVQLSAICKMEAQALADLSARYALPIVCTHSPLERIIADTDALIAEHKTYGCPVIGLGSAPGDVRASVAELRAFFDSLRAPAQKIRDAGLRFAYHNHNFEFEPIEGVRFFDILLSDYPEFDFILDTYWVRYAGCDTSEYIRRIGEAKRMQCIHFKDMKTEPKGDICPCGAGITDFAPIVRLCTSLGIENALVEQDNAPALGDEFAQMKFSYDHLKSLF